MLYGVRSGLDLSCFNGLVGPVLLVLLVCRVCSEPGPSPKAGYFFFLLFSFSTCARWTTLVPWSWRLNLVCAQETERTGHRRLWLSKIGPMDLPVADLGNFLSGKNDSVEVEGFKHQADEIFQKVDQLEQRVNEIEQFYSTMNVKQPNASKSSSVVKDKDKERHVPSLKKQQQDATRREAAAGKRMLELMRQFGTILRQITQHKWAWPFMQPVDVKGLELDDYFEVIDKPMDFSTIKNQMEAKDGTGYKNVREICADMRLVFKNAMKYNDERSDVHVMAKTLMAKFEEKWLQLLPKVTEEEKRREDEEAEAQMDMQLAQEAAHARMARDISNELYEVDMQLEELREMVVRKCRKLSTEEKRTLGIALTKLSPEDLSKVLEIVAQNNPSFQAAAEEVDLDIDAQSETTLWRLKFFVKEALEIQGKTAVSTGGNSNQTTLNNLKNGANATTATTTNNNNHNKRRKEICDAVARTANKKAKKLSA